jgi:hypothetical protein
VSSTFLFTLSVVAHNRLVGTMLPCAENITSSGGNVSSWTAGTWNSASSSMGGSSSSASSWVPQWAAQQINAAWSYVERVISSTGGAAEEGMPTSSFDSESQEHLQTWQAGSAPGQLSWATVLPQALPQGLKTLQSKVPQLLPLQKHDPMQLPVTAQHAYQLQAEAAEANRVHSSGERWLKSMRPSCDFRSSGTAQDSSQPAT